MSNEAGDPKQNPFEARWPARVASLLGESWSCTQVVINRGLNDGVTFSSCLDDSLGGEDNGRRQGLLRRWIRLICAGWLPHDLIRRGLPLSSGGRPTP